ncbi:cellulose synthase/poly-beta-1,6-N-acetylglucosamine synthase-like glycosyltransferase [Pseudomonas frederiksbergensis]|jgi:cellulose synthase/poly-beta-1,6-N-acetylglucosamine synthase-like glycosyltransferase|uniref:Cellulose synthase/poly-beta-1,6-N-acetylglucosamine synthase-like glycosyltransferase n=1 Tax=Pseudomonas umsongensis TaxID=198618 RepID=A0ACC5M9F3_9PSED|nr:MULTISPECIES: hypothetical protein [Pseudomonas]MBB2885286.1 cellulose synthase/poly-beta-1,6-N-acetylglucosamine synthase-like glycosyltransferase [Pseudomonas umsongensis]MBD9616531.1 hypothetical protein [Pseudomonas sp. PDM07]NMN74926.1 hypothetical protein [Pseudomonas sp. KD5]QDV96472.1 hypothetical protein FFH90_020115 [Pseudomonas sp. ATCC 43928]CAH0282846.1 hypothetical protein SRABI130_04120 [Pseudomonas sp. Bi130]
MKIGYRYVLAWLPTTQFLIWLKISTFAYQYLECHGDKGLPLPCMWNGIDLQGWIGAGMFFGMILFWFSLPVAAYISLEIWLRAYKAKLDAGGH